MITRFAFFEGHVAPERAAEFRKAVIEELVPTWQVFPGASAVRVTLAGSMMPASSRSSYFSLSAL